MITMTEKEWNKLNKKSNVNLTELINACGNGQISRTDLHHALVMREDVVFNMGYKKGKKKNKKLNVDDPIYSLRISS